MLGSSGVAAQLAASQEGLSSIKLVQGIEKETIRENVKITRKENVRYCQLKQQKP
jgi:hypothetical protein